MCQFRQRHGEISKSRAKQAVLKALLAIAQRLSDRAALKLDGMAEAFVELATEDASGDLLGWRHKRDLQDHNSKVKCLPRPAITNPIAQAAKALPAISRKATA